MGTVLYDKDGLEIKRFWGGNERGVCYQVTRRNEQGEIMYVALTEKEVIEILALLFAKAVLTELFKLKPLIFFADACLCFRSESHTCRP